MIKKSITQKQRNKSQFKTNVFRKVLALGLSISLLSGYPLYMHSGSIVTYADNAVTPLDKESYIKNGTILHCFSWSFNTIKEKLPEIKAAGFTAIQTSPVNAIAKGKDTQMKLMGTNPENGNFNGEYGAWYWHYQPTDWTIGNWQLGNEEQFKEMVAEADRLGIQVLVDVVPNHTTPHLNQISKNFVNAVGGWDDMYHENAHVDISQPLKIHTNPAGTIVDYNNRTQTTTMNLLTLADVNTENPRFQEYYLKYLNKLIDYGVDGFRYDTGKHIALPEEPRDPKVIREGQRNNFWDVATGRESVNGVSLKDKDNLFIYGEILQDSSVSDRRYTDYVYMTASNYGKYLRGTLATGNPYNEHHPGLSTDLGNVKFNSDFNELGKWRHDNPDKIVTWVESHDTYFNEGESAHLDARKIRFGWAAITARDKGTPLFFSRPKGSNGWGDQSNGRTDQRFGENVLGVAGDDQFMHPEVREVNLFRQAMIGQGEYLRSHGVTGNDNKVYQIDRGTLGTVIINALDQDLEINYPTTMAEGEYIDHVQNTDNAFRVTNVNGKNQIQGKVKAGSIAVIYKADAELNAVNSIHKPYFFGQQTEVTLTALNTVNNTYTLPGKDPVPFSSGDKVLITVDGNNNKAKIKLKGNKAIRSADGSTQVGEAMEKDIEFTHISDAYDVYFEKHDSWQNASMYVFRRTEGNTVVQNGWPGENMTELGFGLYGGQIPENIKRLGGEANIIFTDSHNRHHNGPRDPEDENRNYAFDQGALTQYLYDKTKPYPERWNKVHKDGASVVQPLKLELEATDVSPFENTDVTFTARASEGSIITGTYKYQFSVEQNGNKQTYDFTENNSFTWKSEYPGNAYITVNVKSDRAPNIISSKTMILHWKERTDLNFDRTYDVYFKKPASWRRDSLHIYAYKEGDSSSSTQLTTWPGERLTNANYIGGDVYGFNLPEDKEDYLIMFNDDAQDGTDKRQFPYGYIPALPEIRNSEGHVIRGGYPEQPAQPGLPAIKGGSMYLENFGTLQTGDWKMVAKDPIHVTLETATTSPQIKNTPVTFRANATGGVGTLKYRFSKVEGAVATSSNAGVIYSVAQDFGDSNTFTLTSDEAKIYTIKVEVKDSSSDYHYTDTSSAFASAYAAFEWKAEPNEPAQPPVVPNDPNQPAQPPVTPNDPSQPVQPIATPSNPDQPTPPPVAPSNPAQPTPPPVAPPSNPLVPPITIPDVQRAIPQSVPRQRRIYNMTHHLTTPFVGALHYVSSTNFWFKQNDKWTAMEKDGTHAVNSWKHFEWQGKQDWYYFDQNGYMLNGWHWIDGKCYYFDQNGKLLMNTVTPDGYLVNANGEWTLNNKVQVK